MTELTLVDRHQAYLAKKGISAHEIAKAYNIRLPKPVRSVVDPILKSWIVQARNEAVLHAIEWKLPDSVLLPILERVGAASLARGDWILARWDALAHEPGNSLFIQSEALVDLNSTATRHVQRALLSTMVASKTAIPVGRLPPSVPAKPATHAPRKPNTGLGSVPAMPSLEPSPAAPAISPKLEKLVETLDANPALTRIDFHFLAAQAQRMGFTWQLTGAEFKNLLKKQPKEFSAKELRLYPRRAAEPIKPDNVIWGLARSLDLLARPEYQAYLDKLANREDLNPVELTLADKVFKAFQTALPDFKLTTDPTSRTGDGFYRGAGWLALNPQSIKAQCSLKLDLDTRDDFDFEEITPLAPKGLLAVLYRELAKAGWLILEYPGPAEVWRVPETAPLWDIQVATQVHSAFVLVQLPLAFRAWLPLFIVPDIGVLGPVSELPAAPAPVASTEPLSIESLPVESQVLAEPAEPSLAVEPATSIPMPDIWDPYRNPSNSMLADWFQCTPDEWVAVSVENREAYIWFKLRCHRTANPKFGCIQNPRGHAISLRWFVEALDAVGGLKRIGYGPDLLMPTRINLKHPFRPGNIALMSWHAARVLHGDFIQNESEVARHARIVDKLKAGIEGAYYRDRAGTWYPLAVEQDVVSGREPE